LDGPGNRRAGEPSGPVDGQRDPQVEANPHDAAFNKYLEDPNNKDKYESLSPEKQQKFRQLFDGKQELNSLESQIPPEQRPALQSLVDQAKQAGRNGDVDNLNHWIGELKASISRANVGEGSSSGPTREPFPERAPGVLPHNGKHVPSLNSDWSDAYRNQQVISQTQSSGEAKYNTNSPDDLYNIEKSAHENGLQLNDNFSIIHRFRNPDGSDRIIGASLPIGGGKAETTAFIRMDGDHGHPITEGDFDRYVKRNVSAAKSNGGTDRLSEISDYLRQNGLNPRQYGIKD
jgi:hypothetical protein